MSCIDSYEDSEDSEEDDDGEDDEGAQEAVQEASDPADFKDFFLDDWKDFSQEDLERMDCKNVNVLWVWKIETCDAVSAF